MRSLQRRTGIVSAALLVPALFLSATGILYVACNIEAANRLIEAMMAHTVFKLLLSPVVVLGGPLVTFALNAWKIVHLSADIVNEEFVIALSVKRLFGHLLFLALSGGLMLLLATHAFVENFRIVAR